MLDPGVGPQPHWLVSPASEKANVFNLDASFPDL